MGWKQRKRAELSESRDGEQPCHLDRRAGGVVALVALVAARALERLLLVLHGQHAERAWNPGLELSLLDAVRGRRADVVVVIGLATDHDAEADDAGITAGVRTRLRRQRQLECAGNVVHVNAALGHSLLRQPASAPAVSLAASSS